MIARLACLIVVLAAAPAAAQSPDGPILIPGAGWAAPAGPPPPPRRQVFISPAGEPFRAEPGAAYPAAIWFARADADHDGALTLAEFTADALAFFDTLDTDKDQVVDGFESSHYELEIAPEIAETPRTARGSGERRGLFGGSRRDRPIPREGAGVYGLLNEPHPVRGADSNLDQRVSRAEAEAAARQRFQLLDANQTGRLTLADLPKTPAQNRLAGPSEGRRPSPPTKRTEMRLQSAPANRLSAPLGAVESIRETP
ncbi:MAG: hypothetical protein Q8L66_08845 [Caulobacter sp.]|nr:hypothetical protein [Caulobacter sp.]